MFSSIRLLNREKRVKVKCEKNVRPKHSSYKHSHCLSFTRVQNHFTACSILSTFIPTLNMLSCGHCSSDYPFTFVFKSNKETQCNVKRWCIRPLCYKFIKSDTFDIYVTIRLFHGMITCLTNINIF